MARTPSAMLEALLFAHGGPLERTQLATLLGISAEELAGAVDELSYALNERGLALVYSDTEIELRTNPDAADIIAKYRQSELARDLGKASLETLAIILYRGTATRSEIDWVRGVNSGAALRVLSLRGLIERTEDKEDKRRARYTATLDALAHLGLSSREELPRYSELSAALSEEDGKRELASADV